MAEFKEVAKHIKRMCDIEKGNCRNCKLSSVNNRFKLPCYIFTLDYPEETEEYIMQWAKENPEQRYPTWCEWQNENFPDRERVITLCYFDTSVKKTCGNTLCSDCVHSEIPEYIAKKLGIEKR